MLNKVIIMGRLTADPELRQTPNGISTCQFTVAVERNFTPQGGERQSDFITVVAWRQTAEFVSRYFAKGRMICVEGNLRTRTYDDKRYPDVRHYVTEVYADSVYFTGEKVQQGGGYGGNPNGNYGGNYAPQQFAQPASQQPAPPQPVQDVDASVSIGNFDEFEEVIGEGDLPF